MNNFIGIVIREMKLARKLLNNPDEWDYYHLLKAAYTETEGRDCWYDTQWFPSQTDIEILTKLAKEQA